ncbi:GNAT family N-acetyltransferase [Arsenicicoccus sp. MKL-02]|uniref:GNAT family N-acetyltransferase n=1 Tax=Arsenicicoccus cauae TaxID=2663847 RepID=A0A6I3J064_9MICO|nr:GNAT family N-acetyltransferase [Arsenicicoccus cauae]MTB72696.1 GNAT family N-acetyltransferase [Arsenicicoccus cauae]
MADVPAIVGLLRDDPLGADREVADLEPYVAAFHRIEADRSHLLVVVRDEADPHEQVLGTMQLTILPGLSRSATTRLQVEAVRVADRARGSGLGAAMLAWAHQWGRERGASLSQLTTDLTRQEAHRFYDRLGYAASHAGLKLDLAQADRSGA